MSLTYGTSTILFALKILPFQHGLLLWSPSHKSCYGHSADSSTLFKVGKKDTETVSVPLMGTLNTACLTYFSDNLLSTWRYYSPWQLFLLFCKYFFNLDLLCCWVICIFICNLITHWQSFWKEEKYLGKTTYFCTVSPPHRTVQTQFST